ncbi:MAG: Secreted protein [Candidatus Daviesbacteria bacterium GW2011_GWA1_41_61]|uniref:Secreted protein n=1 Tax=Candidatus Daviesbacteria bacterium GW2011_GWA2_40_9 TaxID=1618424 RepID=A0A0G0X4X9_9BACT|nr:MAG: SCE65.34c, secreted protein [Candidatus Daviesbacteria bacterium GW2011_GWC1_40_9]KKR82672.1 MAG: Secreted protein [Candidatus Daviesbacteria bacterium GW2011_GWA2_40_9]KKR93372.1 MAG: Secreted protein [Candidatus Daviesbacteria bacterium GW2011_GWB1_41_15]KKS15079.1 MAG: Secreted protein [Candidatus Daviesbacteria bacterium GW2011_GWA1_41_61]
MKYFFLGRLKKISASSAKYSLILISTVISTLLLQQIIFRTGADAQEAATQNITTTGTVVVNASTVIINSSNIVQATPTTTLSAAAQPVSAPTALKSYYINPSGSDENNGLSADKPFKTIQKAVDLAQGGETIALAPGTYSQDIITKRNGTSDKPIIISGPKEAVIKGGGKGRIFEINHDSITLRGFTIDGLFGSSSSSSGYRDKLLYVQGKETKSGVTGLKVLGMTLKNAGGECIRLRYFAQNNEIAGNTITNCGVYDFKFNGGGKNGEGIYIGTAPEQLGDGKNPTSDPDQSNGNFIHDNTIDTQGNECVDIKEAASANMMENNKCTGQKDSNSGGMDSRGEGNTFKNNEIYGNSGAGIRLGGDKETQGINNNIYQNIIKNNKSGGIKFQRTPQGKVCDNNMSTNDGGNSVGTYGSKYNPTQSCS